jgi:zinc protease
MNSGLQAHQTPGTTGIAAATRLVLRNGMVVLIARNPSAPTVSVRGEIRVGSVLEIPERNGTGVFCGAMLTRGAGERSYQQIVDATEERGCSVHAGGSLHSTVFAAKALSEDLPLVLEILADMIIRPQFSEHEIEKLRGQILMHLREQEQETGFQAGRAAREMLFPDPHPYRRLPSGTAETVTAMHRDDLVAFHRNYHPAIGTIAIVGEIDPPAVRDLVEQAFGEWQGSGDPVVATIPDLDRLSGSRRKDITMDGKLQADIIWGVPGLRRNAPDYYAAMIANIILGQLGLGGRLGEQVRERQGMAYYCYSSLEADLGAGPWSAGAGVNPTNVERAIAAMLHEIEHFRAEGPTEEELSDVRAYLTGSLALGLETNDGIAGRLLSIERHQLGLDYIERYPAIINSVSREEVVAAARTYLSTEDYILAVAGPGSVT